MPEAEIEIDGPVSLKGLEGKNIRITLEGNWKDGKPQREGMIIDTNCSVGDR